MAITKEQIKIIREEKFAEEPSYDPNKVTVVDATDWSLSPDHGIITQETLTSAGVTVALPGGYSLTGSTTVPARMSQIDRLNEIGFGEAVYKTFEIKGDGGEVKCKMKSSIAYPSQKMLPTFTVYHLYPEPECVDVVLGTVFTNMRVEFATDRVLTYSYDITAVKNKIIRSPIPDEDKYKNEPMPIQDYVRALDAYLYADMKVVKLESTDTGDFIFTDRDGNKYTPQDTNNDGYYEKVVDENGNTYSIIDAVPAKEIGTQSRIIQEQVLYLIGRKIHGVSTVRLDLRVENAGRDAYRLGSRFANEYPIRKVVRQDYTGSMTIDFSEVQTEEVDSIELYNEFINGARTEQIIEPTEATFGKLSVVIKVGSAYEIRSTPQQADKRAPSAFGMKLDDPLMCDASIETPALGSPNRCMFILPNVILERADKRDATGQLKTVDLTIRMLPDDKLFKGYEMHDGTTLEDLRAFAVTWLKE